MVQWNLWDFGSDVTTDIGEGILRATMRSFVLIRLRLSSSAFVCVSSVLSSSFALVREMSS